MATLLVRKDGTGSYTSIQSAIMDAAAGDIIDIGPGTFVENIDLHKTVTLQGAGKTQTIIQGTGGLTSVVKQATWALGATTLNMVAGTEGLQKGRIVTSSGIPANTRIVQVNPTSIVISAPTTAAKTVATNVTMAQQVDGTIRVRATNPVIKDLKVIGFDVANPAIEYAGIMFRAAAAGSTSANGFLIENCEIQANGEYALLADGNATIGNGTIKSCIISGKTFSGDYPATGNQFSVANVPRQLVVFQAVNLPIIFIDNLITGLTGGLTIDGIPSYNTAVTIDALNSVVTGNTFNGTFGYGYALRVRTTATVENNQNNIAGSKSNSGFVFGPTGAQVTALNIGTNLSIAQALVIAAQASAQAPVKVEMDKAQIVAINKVATDAVFGTEANWKIVSYIFKKVGSPLRLVSGFKDFGVQKDIKLKPGMESGDQFELHKIIISDASRNLLVLKRTEIADASQYDFVLK